MAILQILLVFMVMMIIIASALGLREAILAVFIEKAKDALSIFLLLLFAIITVISFTFFVHLLIIFT